MNSHVLTELEYVLLGRETNPANDLVVVFENPNHPTPVEVWNALYPWAPALSTGMCWKDLRHDVERALRIACTSVQVGANEGPTDEEKREQEESNRQDERRTRGASCRNKDQHSLLDAK